MIALLCNFLCLTILSQPTTQLFNIPQHWGRPQTWHITILLLLLLPLPLLLTTTTTNNNNNTNHDHTHSVSNSDNNCE